MQDHSWLMPLPEEVFLFLLNTPRELYLQNAKVQQKTQIISMLTKIQVTSLEYFNTSLFCPPKSIRRIICY